MAVEGNLLKLRYIYVRLYAELEIVLATCRYFFMYVCICVYTSNSEIWSRWGVRLTLHDNNVSNDSLIGVLH